MRDISVRTNILPYVIMEPKNLIFVPLYFKSLWLELDFLGFHRTVQIG